MAFPEPTDLQFAAWFRGWNRLEARSRKDDFALSLAATTADPLWALARQWQLLELKGEDAGTPIHAKLRYETAAPDEVQLGDQPFQALNGVPLEVLIEREMVQWDWRLRVRAGQQYERLARVHDAPNAAALIEQARTRCPVAVPATDRPEWRRLDLASRRFVSLMAGRAIDGKTLLEEIDAGTLSTTITGRWKRWWEQLYSHAPGTASPAWQPTRLDYEFRLRQSPAPTGSLHAASYRNGTVDWNTFTVDRSPVPSFASEETLPLTPVHARYAGQPMRRWWEFEDRAVDFGALDVAKTDLGKLILMEFALVFGDDWFVLPLTADPNSLVRITDLRVRDCFGLVTRIEPARRRSSNPLAVWDVFALTSARCDGQAADFLYVPPLTGDREESPVLEEVRFARDEGANLVFAIESTVPNQLGEPASGFASHLEYLRRGRVASGDAEASEESEAGGDATDGATAALPSPHIEYVLATSVPTNWIPYLATDEQNVVAGMPQRSVKLHRGRMVSTEVGDGMSGIAPQSRLLEGADWVHEEAVGRAGVRVELRRQRMRTATGATFVWLGRKVGVGRGEARSGLRFDAVSDSATALSAD